MKIDVTADIAALSKTLDDIGRNQIPFAAARAITSAAKLSAATVTQALPTIFDRPTPFTMRAIGTTPATKANLTATVFVKDAQAAYLGLEETGGTRLPSGTALVIPVDIKLNQYGNMKKNAIAAALAKPNTFSGSINGVAGVWQRPAYVKQSKRRRGVVIQQGKPILLVAYERTATYKPKFHFRDQVVKSVTRNLPSLLRLRMIEALATAK